uniref:Uncharacterized protein n=1 Tax=Glossina pallidipes TaxID=7398 RepID=A0A1B0A915_GLOPL
MEKQQQKSTFIFERIFDRHNRPKARNTHQQNYVCTYVKHQASTSNQRIKVIDVLFLINNKRRITTTNDDSHQEETLQNERDSLQYTTIVIIYAEGSKPCELLRQSISACLALDFFTYHWHSRTSKN